LNVEEWGRDAAAERLFAMTTTMLASLTSARPGVDPARLRHLLDSPVFATVSTLDRHGAPHQSVVWIDRDGEDVLFSVAAGSAKARNIRRDPRVSILVSPPSEPYTYAAIRGEGVLTEDPSGELLDRLARKYTGESYGDHHAEAASQQTGMAVVRVRPQRVVGRL
jgi:PPOX class probable F420-dependent enzyme